MNQQIYQSEILNKSINEEMLRLIAVMLLSQEVEESNSEFWSDRLMRWLKVRRGGTNNNWAQTSFMVSTDSQLGCVTPIQLCTLLQYFTHQPMKTTRPVIYLMLTVALGVIIEERRTKTGKAHSLQPQTFKADLKHTQLSNWGRDMQLAAEERGRSHSWEIHCFGHSHTLLHSLNLETVCFSVCLLWMGYFGRLATVMIL